MTPASEQELAFSMIRMWGKRAGTLARNYATECQRRGDASGSGRWRSVERIVDRAQIAPPASVAASNHVLQAGPVKRRSLWFEALLAAVVAIQRLGGATIRGTSL
jgi:hypothetical protein